MNDFNPFKMRHLDTPPKIFSPVSISLATSAIRILFLRVPAHRLRNFLLMVAMHDYYYCILTGASPLQHKDKVPAEGAAH